MNKVLTCFEFLLILVFGVLEFWRTIIWDYTWSSDLFHVSWSFIHVLFSFLEDDTTSSRHVFSDVQVISWLNSKFLLFFLSNLNFFRCWPIFKVSTLSCICYQIASTWSFASILKSCYRVLIKQYSWLIYGGLKFLWFLRLLCQCFTCLLWSHSTSYFCFFNCFLLDFCLLAHDIRQLFYFYLILSYHFSFVIKRYIWINLLIWKFLWILAYNCWLLGPWAICRVLKVHLVLLLPFDLCSHDITPHLKLALFKFLIIRHRFWRFLQVNCLRRRLLLFVLLCGSSDVTVGLSLLHAEECCVTTKWWLWKLVWVCWFGSLWIEIFEWVFLFYLCWFNSASNISYWWCKVIASLKLSRLPWKHSNGSWSRTSDWLLFFNENIIVGTFICFKHSNPYHILILSQTGRYRRRKNLCLYFLKQNVLLNFIHKCFRNDFVWDEKTLLCLLSHVSVKHFPFFFRSIREKLILLVSSGHLFFSNLLIFYF